MKAKKGLQVQNENGKKQEFLRQKQLGERERERDRQFLASVSMSAHITQLNNQC